MLNMIFRMKSKKKAGSPVAIGGAISLAAVLGGLITWYTARRMKHRRENEFYYTRDDESQP